MIRNFTLSVILSLCASLFCKFASAITYVNNGTNTNYTLNAGDSLYIASGTYTGTISGLNSVSAKITVSDMAIFQPAGFPNNAVCTMNVYEQLFLIIIYAPIQTLSLIIMEFFQ